MLVADQGIVLHYITYSESSLIIKVLTKEKGVISYSKKALKNGIMRKIKISGTVIGLGRVLFFWGPIHHQVHRAQKPFKSLHNQIYKSAALIFMNCCSKPSPG